MEQLTQAMSLPATHKLNRRERESEIMGVLGEVRLRMRLLPVPATEKKV